MSPVQGKPQLCVILSHRSRCAAPRAQGAESIDLRKLADIMSTQPLDVEQRYTLEKFAEVLEESVGTVKNMVFKKRGMLSMSPEEIKDKIETIAKIVDVTYDQARRMAVIQPGLLFETEKQAQVLQYGIRSICYELTAPKDEVVDLILNNQSVLHGRELHLSVADMAHLAIIREPKGRIVD